MSKSLLPYSDCLQGNYSFLVFKQIYGEHFTVCLNCNRHILGSRESDFRYSAVLKFSRNRNVTSCLKSSEGAGKTFLCRGKHGNEALVGLKKRFRNTGCAAKVSVNLEGRMYSKEICECGFCKKLSSVLVCIFAVLKSCKKIYEPCS